MGLPAKGMRILVTNDDGIHAPGMKALTKIAKSVTSDVWVVAPETEQSATSHALTLRRPLRIRRLGPRRIAVDGTPTDCVLVAQHRILRDHPADLVLSGVNHGANLGEDVVYSGTVAAAMEAALLGYLAVAFSQVRRRNGKVNFGPAEAHGAKVLQDLLQATWAKDVLINVNFPPIAPDEVTGIRVCRQGRRLSGIEVVEGHAPYGGDFVWIGDFLSDDSSHRESDLAAVKANAISVTPLHFDMTHQAALRKLKGALS